MERIRIVEVGPRDGLQNEPTPIPTDVKLRFIENLVGAGLREIEATSFVSPKWVPQLADGAELWTQLPSGAQFSALVPNMRGLDTALEVQCSRIALFTAASDAFTQRNINMTVDASLEVFGQVAEAFRSTYPDGWLRAYVSTAFECPFEGRQAPEKVVRVANRLEAMKVDEISLGDTIGVASPREVGELVAALRAGFEGPMHRIAWHFHDTRGTAIANVARTLELGEWGGYDSSAAGLGGCPYAPGAGGNLATEDLVYFLEREGLRTGVDGLKLAQASAPILEFLRRAPASRAQVASLVEKAPTQ